MKQLRWIQPKWNRRHYELKDGEQTIARLEYRSWWKDEVFIILDQEELVVKGKGFFKSQYAILRGSQEIALYNGPDAKQQLVFMTGRRFTWKRLNKWSSPYSFLAADNDVLMTFKSGSRFFRMESIVELADGSAKYPETRLLLAFGWYLTVSAAQHTAATAG